MPGVAVSAPTVGTVVSTTASDDEPVAPLKFVSPPYANEMTYGLFATASEPVMKVALNCPFAAIGGFIVTPLSVTATVPVGTSAPSVSVPPIMTDAVPTSIVGEESAANAGVALWIVNARATSVAAL